MPLLLFLPDGARVVVADLEAQLPGMHMHRRWRQQQRQLLSSQQHWPPSGPQLHGRRLLLQGALQSRHDFGGSIER